MCDNLALSQKSQATSFEDMKKSHATGVEEMKKSHAALSVDLNNLKVDRVVLSVAKLQGRRERKKSS